HRRPAAGPAARGQRGALRVRPRGDRSRDAAADRPRLLRLVERLPPPGGKRHDRRRAGGRGALHAEAISRGGREGRHAMTSVTRAQPARHGAAVELVIVAAAFVSISVSSALTQRMERLYADGQHYQWMAVQFFESHLPITAGAPWVYRVATPWLAARLRPAVARTLPRLISIVEYTSGMAGDTT